MARNKTLMNMHAKNYIKAVFAQRLMEEGFRCPDDKLLCWYRMRPGGIYDTIVFSSKWSHLPVDLHILHEVSPLFFAPLRIHGVQYSESTHMRLDCRRGVSNREAGSSFMQFSDEIQVFAPEHGGRGIRAFDKVILPKLNSIRSMEDCYQAHEAAHRTMDGEISYWSASREFIAEAVYLDHTEVYPNCRERVSFALGMYERLVDLKPNKQELSLMLEDWDLLYGALFEDGREEYLQILEQRMEKNRKLLKEWGVIEQSE